MGRYELMTARRLGTADHRNRPDAMSLDPLGAGVRTAPRRIRQPGMVRRERVLRELNDVAEDVPLILVTAPAGFGKTTLLQQWAADDSREFGWVQLDEADNDPARLLRHIALAMHRIRPIDYPAWRSLGPPVDALVETVLPRLLRAAVGGGPPWVLVLDDIHHLRGALGAEAILAFANALPPGYHVVASGRHRAGLRLSGLRRQGRCVEIGAGHLAFRREEVASVLRTAGVPAAPATVDRVLQRTEGWPAGVYLTALSMRGASGRADAPPQALAGTEFIADYLRDEVLRNESEETLRFLRRTAVLEQMSAPLCNAVLLETCSVARLGDLEDRNLFVTRPDPGRLWYRYHPLLRETLLAELRRREPAEENVIHRRASAWYEAHGYATDAVSHAAAAGDAQSTARLVTRYGRACLNAGRLPVVRTWLGALSDGATEAYPGLAVVAGWTWALTGDAARAQECLRAAEIGAFGASGTAWPAEAPRGRRAALASSIAQLRTALAPFGVDQMLVDARRAVELEPSGSCGFPVAATLLGMALLATGDGEAARGQLERSAHAAYNRQRGAASFALAELALIAADQDDWTVAESCATEAGDLIRGDGLAAYPSSTAVYLAAARVAAHQRNIHLARHHLSKAAALYDSPSPAAFPWLAAQLALGLARIAMDLDDYPAALRRVAEARRHLARLPDTGALSRGCAKLTKDIARHGDRLRYSYSVTLTAAEMRVLQMLPTHLTLAEIADLLYISRNTVKSQVASIYGKLHSSTRAEAVRAARERELVE